MYEEELRPVGLTPSQYELLETLAAMPGVSQGQLAEQIGADQTTLSRNLKVLLQRRWLRLRASDQDGRISVYTLTSAGSSVRRSAEPLWRRAQERVQASLGPEWPGALLLLQRLQQIGATETGETD